MPMPMRLSLRLMLRTVGTGPAAAPGGLAGGPDCARTGSRDGAPDVSESRGAGMRFVHHVRDPQRGRGGIGAHLHRRRQLLVRGDS